jgi:uncharacterized membrane protein YedE/YeeE
VGGLRETIAGNAPVWLALGGLLIGMVFGYIVFRTNFCTMGSISDIVSFGDYRRFRAWLLAGATAIIGAQLLDAAGVVALSKSMYLGANLNWFGHIFGGLMFGYGMVFAGGCASRNLARAGAGDLRSLLTLVVMGLFAYIAIGGLLGPLRDFLERMTVIGLGATQAKTQGLGNIVGVFVPGTPVTINLAVAALIAGTMLLYCFKDESFRTSKVHVLSGIGIGLCAIAGWALTGLAFDELADRPMAPISLTYVRPTADAIEWLQRFTAGMMPGFGVTTVFGAILGSFIAAKSMGRFQLTTFADLADTKRSLFGAVLMGIGGVMALGCTVGQAITGISTLALGSFLTFAAIVTGGYYGMKRLEQILMDEI